MTGSRVRTCVTTPILDTLHFSVNGPSRHAASYAESPVNDLDEVGRCVIRQLIRDGCPAAIRGGCPDRRGTWVTVPRSGSGLVVAGRDGVLGGAMPLERGAPCVRVAAHGVPSHAFENCAGPSTTGRDCTRHGRIGTPRSPMNGPERG